MIRTVLTDAQWAVIAPHCLGRECDPGRTGPDPRRFVEAVLWDLADRMPLARPAGRVRALEQRVQALPKVGEGPTLSIVCSGY